MKKNREKFIKINNIACIVMMVVLFASLFLPSWDFIANIKTKDFTCENCGYTLRKEALEDEFTCPECDAPKRDFDSVTIREQVPSNSSIMEYTWMAFNNKDLTKQFQAEGYVVNDIVLAPFLLTLFFAFGIVFSIVNIRGTWQSLFPFAGSILMTFSLLTNSVLQQGPYWIVNLVLSIVTIVVSLGLVIQLIKTIINWATVPVAK